MPKEYIQYDKMRDDQILYWLHFLKFKAEESVQKRWLTGATKAAFKRGLIGEDWYDFYIGNTEEKPYNRWASDDLLD